jgi:hypothetical protein
LLRLGVNHVDVVGGEFVVQTVGRMRKEIAVLVHRAWTGIARPAAEKVAQVGSPFVARVFLIALKSG